MRSLTADALNGGGHLTAVLGEAGIGKTELLVRHTAELKSAGQQVVYGNCWTGDDVPPYWAWSQILRQLSVSRPEAFGAAKGRYGDLLVSLLPEHQKDAGAASERNDELMQARFLTHDAVCETIRALTCDRPLIIVLEDLHWADGPSLELLRLLSTRMHGSRLSVVVTVRESGIGAEPPPSEVMSGILGGPRTRTLHLCGLSEPAIGALVTAQAGTDVGADVIGALHVRSRGNPYLLGQLLSLIGGAKRPRDGRAVQAVLTEIPASTRGVLRRRFAALPALVVRALRGCAVLGTDVDLNLLRGVMDEGDALEPAIEAAIQTGLLRRHPQDPGRLSFSHVLVQETLLGELSGDERTRLHIRTADILLARPRASHEDIDRIAHHLWQASAALPAAEVLPQLLRAAEQAEQRRSYDQSETWLRRALHLLPSLPLEDPSNSDLELRLQDKLAHVLTATAGYGDAEAEATRRSIALHAATGAPEKPAALWEECCAQIVTGRYDESLSTAERLQTIAEATGDPAAELCATYGRGIVLHVRGQLTEALLELERSAEISDRFSSDERATLARVIHHDPRIPCRGYAALTHWLMGSFEEAGQLREHLLALTEYDHTPADRAFVRYLDALLAALSGDAETAARSSAIGLETAARYGLRHWTLMLRVCQGWTRAHAGDDGSGSGSALIQSATDDLRANRVLIRLPLHLGLLAQAQHTEGRTDKAAATLARLATEIRLRDERAYLSPLLPFNTLGQLARTR